MSTRRTVGLLPWTLAAALLAVVTGCGEARTTEFTSTECTTCHGQPPAKDAHAIHFAADSGETGGIPHSQFKCFQCHKNVQQVGDPDHIQRANGAPVPPPAEVRWDQPGSLGATTQEGATRAAPPRFDTTTRTCSNVYCHGAGLQGATSPGIIAAPAWDAPAGTITCGKCHGIPPADHNPGITLANCIKCHGDAVDASGKPNPATHVNGVVELAPSITSSCAACHGDGSANVPPGDPRSAPPTDAEGRPASDPNAVTVGAHQEHVTAADSFGPKVACSECHVVPATLLAPGHIDNQVTLTFGPLARTGGLNPSYDAATQTCSNVYCHGNFPNSKASGPPPAPTWRQGDTAIACGTCHDLPPPPPAHVTVDVATQGCGTSTNPVITCHPSTYSPTTVDPALHIDGRICPPNCTPAP